MAEYYKSGLLPEEYDRALLEAEFARIERALSFLSVPLINFLPQAVAPARPQEGDVAAADGTNWNPGAGAGLYEYRGGTWNKL